MAIINIIEKGLKKLGYRGFLVIVTLASCNVKDSNKNNFDSELFSLSFNKDCNLSFAKENDRYSGMFIINETDTFFYNAGFFISNLSYKIPEVIISTDSSEIKSSDENVLFTRDKNYDFDRLKKQNIEYYPNNGYCIKMTYPIRTENSGLIGIYIDSLINTPVGNLKLNIYSNRLYSRPYSEIMNVFREIKIYHFDTSIIDIPYGTYYVN